MKDLNFFEPYIDKRQVKFDRKLIYTSLGMFIVLLFFVYSIFNYILIKQEEKLISTLKVIAENEETLEKVEEIKQKEIETAEFKESVEKIVLLDETLEKTDIIDKRLINEIISHMPSELFISSINIRTSDIEIVGMSEDKWSIAEFGRGLDGIEEFEDVFVTNISREGDHYNYNINVMVENAMIENIITEDVVDDGEIEEENED